MPQVIKLSPRLQKIADLIKPCDHLLDVGCDHGYLSIFLVLNQQAKHVLNLDINQEPLQSAKNNAIAYQVDQLIDCQLNNGLANLELDYVPDYVTISGMGGVLISLILEHSSICPHQYVLQPNNNVEKLRQWLFENQYQIVNEEIVFDHQIGYCILQVIKTDHPVCYDLTDLYIGPSLRFKSHESQVIKYYQQKYHQLSKIPANFINPEKANFLTTVKEFLHVKD